MKTKYYTKYMYHKAVAYLLLLLSLAAFLLLQHSFEITHIVLLGLIAIKAYVSLYGNCVEVKESKIFFKIKNKKYDLRVDDILSIEWPKEQSKSKEFAAMLFTSKVVDENGEVKDPGHLLFNFAEYTRDDVECILRYAINGNPSIQYGRILNEIRFSDSLPTEKAFMNQKIMALGVVTFMAAVMIFLESRKGLTSSSLTNLLIHLIKLFT